MIYQLNGNNPHLPQGIFFNKHCLSASAKSIMGSSPLKTWPAYSLPCGMGVDFLPARCILHNLAHQERYIKSLIFFGEFLSLTPMSWGELSRKFNPWLWKIRFYSFLISFYSELQIAYFLPRYSVNEIILMR